MVEFTAAPSDLETGLGPHRVVLVEKRSSSGRMWTVIGVLSLLLVCSGGVLMLVWHLNGKAETSKPESGQFEAFRRDRIHSTDASETTSHSNTLSSIGSSAKSAIHLEARPIPPTPEPAEGQQLQWLSSQGQAFSQGGFTVEQNRIVIPASGLYFVYSQASYHVSCGAERDEGEQAPLSHRILRHADSMGGEVPLISGVRSACQSAAGSDPMVHQSIYLGAVFKLRAGDLLRTDTNQLSRVETENGKTFFGVFAL